MGAGVDDLLDQQTTEAEEHTLEVRAVHSKLTHEPTDLLTVSLIILMLNWRTFRISSCQNVFFTDELFNR
jgi:hypothetical protein